MFIFSLESKILEEFLGEFKIKVNEVELNSEKYLNSAKYKKIEELPLGFTSKKEYKGAVLIYTLFYKNEKVAKTMRVDGYEYYNGKKQQQGKIFILTTKVFEQNIKKIRSELKEQSLLFQDKKNSLMRQQQNQTFSSTGCLIKTY